MTDKDSLADRGRALEEEYFRKKDRELVEKMRLAAEADQVREHLGQATGLHDPAVLQELQELGFTAETIVLLPLVPVIEMAWAEGGVTREERELLLGLARRRGIAAGTPAEQQLTAWLATRPHDAVFAGAGRLIRALLDSGSPSTGALTVDEVITQAEQIAAASGGMLGFGKVSAEEKALLAKLVEDLKGRAG